MEGNNLDQRLTTLEQKIDILTNFVVSQASQNAKGTNLEKSGQIEAVTEEEKSEVKPELKTEEIIQAKTINEEQKVSIQKGRLESLLSHIEEMKKDCVDSNFASYLNAMERKVFVETTKLDEIESNLNKNYEKYLQRNNLAQTNSMDAKNVPSTPLVQNESAALVDDAIPSDKINDTKTETATTASAQNAWSQKREHEMRKERNTAVHMPKDKKIDLEFGIGGALLSVIGALFIIAAFVIFGMNYMGSLAQGVLLYGLGGVVIVFSEFVIKKHLEKFSRPMTALGIGILYTATILNYLYLHTINAAIAIVLTFIIAIFSLILSQKRESSILRVVGILGAYICFAPISSMTRNEDFIMPAIISAIINIIYLFLPMQQEKAKKIVANVHACANVIFASSLVIVAIDGEVSRWPIMVFLGVAMIITCLIYRGIELGIASVTLSSICLAAINVFFALSYSHQEYAIFAVLLQAVFVVACFVVTRKQKICWTAIYCFSATSIISLNEIGTTEFYIGIALILLFYKVFAKVKQLRVANIIYSLFAALVMVTAIKDQIGFEYLILAVFLISVVTITYDKLFHVLTLVAVLQITAISAFDFMIALPLALALLLFCLMFFTYVDLVPMRGNKIFGTTLLVWDLCLLLMLITLKQPIALTICLVCELAFLIIYFSESVGYSFAELKQGRYLIYMIYLTYMVFVYRIEIPLVASIILMLLAIASVAVGFIFKQKMVRIYGLLLAFFVCFKLILIDFKGEQSSDRVLLFFFVGILALAISYLYMRIERNLQKEEAKQHDDSFVRVDSSMLNMPQVPLDMEIDQAEGVMVQSGMEQSEIGPSEIEQSKIGPSEIEQEEKNLLQDKNDSEDSE